MACKQSKGASPLTPSRGQPLDTPAVFESHCILPPVLHLVFCLKYFLACPLFIAYLAIHHSLLVPNYKRPQKLFRKIWLKFF